MRTATCGEPSVHRRRVTELCVAPCSGVLEEWRRHHGIKKKDKMRMPPIQVRNPRFISETARSSWPANSQVADASMQSAPFPPPARRIERAVVRNSQEAPRDMEGKQLSSTPWSPCIPMGDMRSALSNVAMERAPYFCARVLGTCRAGHDTNLCADYHRKRNSLFPCVFYHSRT